MPSVCQVLAGAYFTYFTLPHAHLLMRSPSRQHSISFLVVKFPELARSLPDPLLVAFDLGVQNETSKKQKKIFTQSKWHFLSFSESSCLQSLALAAGDSPTHMHLGLF